MIAAGHTGVNASSRLHRGRGHYLNPRKNHLNPKYVSAIFFARWLAPELWENQQ